MAAQQSAGILTLLEAEKEAAKIIQKARDYRNQRVKDARTEAAKEIEAYKAKKEQDFQQYQKEHSGDTDALSKEIDQKTADDLNKINEQFEKNREEVIKKLLGRVLEVNPKPHRNLEKR